MIAGISRNHRFRLPTRDELTLAVNDGFHRTFKDAVASLSLWLSDKTVFKISEGTNEPSVVCVGDKKGTL